MTVDVEVNHTGTPGALHVTYAAWDAGECLGVATRLAWLEPCGTLLSISAAALLARLELARQLVAAGPQ